MVVGFKKVNLIGFESWVWKCWSILPESRKQTQTPVHVISPNKTRLSKHFKKFNHLPNEIWLIIFDHFPEADRRKWSVVSSRFLELFRYYRKMHPIVWTFDSSIWNPWKRNLYDKNLCFLPRWCFNSGNRDIIVDVVYKDGNTESNVSMDLFDPINAEDLHRIIIKQSTNNLMSYYDTIHKIAYVEGCATDDFHSKNHQLKLLKNQSIDNDYRKVAQQRAKNKPSIKFAKHQTKTAKFNKNHR